MFAKTIAGGTKNLLMVVLAIFILLLGYTLLYKIMINEILIKNNYYMHMIKSRIVIQRNAFVNKSVYYPGETLPLDMLDTIRNSSHKKLKRKLSTKEYNQFKELMKGLIKIFNQFNIRYNP